MSAHVHLWLIDPVTDEVIRELSSVDAVTAADIANGVYNLAATYDDGTVGSVRFYLDGTLVKSENGAPYAALGDKNGDYLNAATPADGTVQNWEVRVYSGSSGSGTLLDSQTFQISWGGPVQGAPTASEDSYDATEDTPLTIDAATGLLANDSDAENDPLTAQLVTGPAHGTVTLNADGSFTYTPTANYAGTDSFTYRAHDGTVSSQPTTVTLNVAGTPDAPVVYAPITDAAASVGFAFTKTVPSSAFTDPDGDTLTYTATLADGSDLPDWLTFNAATRTFSGSPADGDIGTISVKVTATDATALNASDVFDIAVSDAPPEETGPPYVEYLWTSEPGLAKPESAQFDPDTGYVFASNTIGGGSGTVSLLDTDGHIVDADFITGLTLPKGLTVLNGLVYIATKSALVVADSTTGEILNTYETPGSASLNDVTVAPDGTAYVTNLDYGEVYRLQNGVFELFIESSQFTNCNGIRIDGDRLLVADFNSGTLFGVDIATKAISTVTTGQARFDGIIEFAPGQWLVSNFSGEVRLFTEGEGFQSLLNTMGDHNSADIGYDPATHTLYVPTFSSTGVMAYRIHFPGEESTPLAAAGDAFAENGAGESSVASGAAPVILDLGGDGFQFIEGVAFDFDGDGVLETGAWAGPDDAILALDRNGDGTVNDISEISFIADLPGATSDLDGLSAFDSNGDGLLSALDEDYFDFSVWIDGNSDGISQPGELRGLAEAEIVSILLQSDGQFRVEGGLTIHGEATVLLADGSQIAAADAEFQYSEALAPMAWEAQLDLDAMYASLAAASDYALL